jgi:dipeptidyl aminopeptidase/acylaminoacyl peptidase
MSTPAAPTPLIPRRLLFGNPDRTTPRISPDGRYISYLAPLDGVLNVWVGPSDRPDQARPVTRDTQRGIREYFWAYTSAHVLYLQDQAGDENWRIFSVDLHSGEIRDLTPLAGVQARVEEVSHRHPDEILVGLNDREPQLHDLYRVNIRTGERQLVLENPGFIGFETHHYEVRLAQTMTPDGGCQFLKPTRGGWELFLAIGSADVLTTGPAGFDETGRQLYLLDSRDRDTTALFSMDIAGGAKTLLAEDPRADAGDVERHPVTKVIQAVSFNYDRRRWQVLDEAVAADFAALADVAAGDFSIVDRTLDDQHWIVAYDLDNGPQRFYRYDRAQRAATYLFTNRRALEDLPLAGMTPVIIVARDGRQLVSYITLPADATGSKPNRPAAPLPTVLLVHGGPWARDEWGYDAWHQWLANRGYAVLSVNFRGSTGFGKVFVNAGDREWGGRMHTDLLDAVAWAVQEGIADRQRVAIMGGSYGGYATLWALTNSPDVFACGVDIVGPSNLLTLLESLPPYWTPMIELFAARVGDHRTNEGRDLLRRRSPLTYAGQIQRPLLIGQGANDPRVKQAESDQIVAAMRSRDIPVTYVLYPDEGHGFARPENSLSFNAIAEAFLGAHLGGRCEPVGADFEGSSVEVPVGREHVPGLAESLAAR